MNTTTPSLRFNAGNPDHHLFLNNGTWWIHYTVHKDLKKENRTDRTKERVRCSLQTRNNGVARRRRDRWLRRLGAELPAAAQVSVGERRVA